MLNGQKLQGPDAAAEVQEWLKEKGQANKYVFSCLIQSLLVYLYFNVDFHYLLLSMISVNAEWILKH